MTRLHTFIASTIGKIILAAVAAALIVSVLFVRSCQAERGAKTAEKVAQGQAQAAQQSGKDAVDTVGKRAAEKAEADKITKENADAIDQAEGSRDAVNPAVRDAGLRSLCRRPEYRRNPKCVQYANP